jgi:hypothetical protein
VADTSQAELQGQDAREAGADRALCPRCLTPYLEGTDLCRSCGAPLGMGSWVGVAKGTQAEGWFIGDAAQRRQPSRALLISAWGVLLPTVVVSLALPFVPGLHWTQWVVALPFGLLVGFVLFRLTRNFLRDRSPWRTETEDPVPDGGTS